MPDPSLPLTDLHRHLEGSVRLSTVLALAQKHHLPLPAADLPSLQRRVWMRQPVDDIVQIFPTFDLLRCAFVDCAACRRFAWECLEDAAAQGVDYLELRFSPLFMAEPHGLDPLGVTAAVCEAWEESRGRLPLTARLLVILSRTYGAEACEAEVQAALAFRERGVVGVDLAGDEARHPAAEFEAQFRRMRAAGLHVSAHAGEFAGADSVRQTVELLGAERLGHAVHAADDPAVLDLLAERGVAIECCPTSNVFTSSVAGYAAHPLPLFLRHGLRATLNTDDPSLFGDITLAHEYDVAREAMGLSADQLRQVQANGLEAAFLTQAEKGALRGERGGSKAPPGLGGM